MVGINSERLKRTLKDMIKIPSINPFDGAGKGEAELAEYIYTKLKSYGLKVHYQDVVGERRNVIAELGGGNGPTLVLNGHMDTVGVENMEIDPFGAEEDANGNIYGRGAADMKGGLAAMIEAVASLADEGAALKGRVVLAAVVDEEHRGLGTKKLVELIKGGWGVVGEPTNLRLGAAHKGVVRFNVTVLGKAAHGSVPHLGVDAVFMSCCLLQEILSTKYEQEHPLLGRPVVHTSFISGGSEWSKVPGRCVIGMERRTLPGEGWKAVKEEVEEAIKRARARCPQLLAEPSLVFEYPPLEADPASRVFIELRRALEALGLPGEPVGLPYWTDGATMAGSGIETVVLGPGDISLAHSASESVPFAQVALAAQIYRAVALSILT